MLEEASKAKSFIMTFFFDLSNKFDTLGAKTLYMPPAGIYASRRDICLPQGYTPPAGIYASRREYMPPAGISASRRDIYLPQGYMDSRRDICLPQVYLPPAGI